MRDDLRTQALVPLTGPFTALGFTTPAKAEGETIDAAVLQPPVWMPWWIGCCRTAHGHFRQYVGGHPFLPAAAAGPWWTRMVRVHHASPRQAEHPLRFGHRNHLGVMTAQPATAGIGGHHRPERPGGRTAPGPVRDVNGVPEQWMGDSSSDGELKVLGQ
ncbi:MAG: hypothetical protein IPH63_02435 [Flavobacteriales bacterium]|nr:hypothetical protein [Flavobacteriales bacterium]